MRRRRDLVVLVLVTFFVISFLTNIINALIPAFREDFNLSLTLAGLLPFAFFIAYGVMSIPAGVLVERAGEKATMMLSFGIAAAGALALAFFANYLVAIVSLFVIGSGMAALQVAINPLLREAGGEEHFAFNSVLGQLFFGLASFLSPLIYSYFVVELAKDPAGHTGLTALMAQLVPANLPWLSVYWLSALLALLMIVVIGVTPFSRVARTADERVGEKGAYAALLKKPLVWLYFLGIFMYVGSEQGVGNWISQFLETYHGYDPQTTGARTVSYFWGMMTAGTLLGLLGLKFIDSRRVLIGFTIATYVCLSVALFGSGETALWAFPAVGFFISVMWSVVFSLALNSVSGHHGAFSGILVTGIAGGAIVPFIVGALGDVFGLRGGMMVLYLTFAYILSIGFWAKPLVTNQTFALGKKRAVDIPHET